MKQLNSSAVNRRSVVLLVIVLVLCLGSFLVWKAISGNDGKGEDYISQINRMQTIPPQLALSAKAATQYDEAAFDELLEGVNSFTRTLDGLIESSEGRSLPVKIDRLSDEINQLRYTWAAMELDVRVIAASKPYVFELYRSAQDVNRAFDQLETQYETAVNALLRGNFSARSVSLVQGQMALIEKARLSLQGVLGGRDAQATAKQFQQHADQLIANHNRIVNGAAGATAATILLKATPQIEVVASNLSDIYDAAPAVYRMGQFADSIAAFSTQLLDDTAQLNEGIDGLFTEQIYARLAIVLVILLIVAFIVYRRIDRRLKRQSEAYARNQEAILRLLDELADLADGDLTTNATVTEDFTGAIADSINFAIDQLRTLVVSINETSVQVSQSADETRSTAIALSEASTKQAEVITEATDSINEIVNSMDSVANNADESSKVASNSVEIANKGAGAVQNTINGMDKIREQIQKTSKQIKRLGESSQEIGDIISLINDIADQTNILSLNAAIQASMAGDAGRGFAVVADEVQRLAERSGAATRQIEVLVKAIQADTNEAVISMEQTTAEVVQGARLAQDAGVALEEIEEVSNSLAQLIQDISDAAGQQSKAAVEIASTMGLIKEISTQTSAGSQETAGSIENLAELAKEMRNSVSGFTLPDTTNDVAPESAAKVTVDEIEVVLDGDASQDDEQKSKQGAGSAVSAA